MPYYYAVLSAVLGTDDANPFIAAFTYETTELVPTSLGADILGTQIEDILLPDGGDLRALLPVDIVFQSITITAPQVPTVLAVRAMSRAGEGVGDYVTAFEAMEWWSPRTLANIRPGFKRFGPTLKANLADGVLAGGAVTLANNVADALSTVLTDDVGGSAVNFTPVIVKRISYTTSGGSTAYRLPNGTDPYVRSIATNWAFKRVSSQNSRKR